MKNRKHPTFNIQHLMPRGQRPLAFGALDVERWMLNVGFSPRHGGLK